MARITNSELSRNVLAANQGNLARVARLQEQLASGKRLLRPSDDPVAARQGLRLRVESFQTGKFLDNITKTTAFVDATDIAFSEISGLFDDVKQVAVQGANGTQDAASRAALASQVDAQLTRLVDLANTSHDGRFLFAGAATTTPPFAASSDGSRVAYRGDLDTFAVQISPTSTATVNRNGHALFKQDNDAFQALIDLRDALRADDPAEVSRLIDDIDAAHDQVNQAHGALGGEGQRLEATRNQLEQARIVLDRLVSDAEDVDLPSAIADLQLTQTALEAGLNVGARVIVPTLLDFLQ